MSPGIDMPTPHLPPYARDSRQAIARVLALALLVDGRAHPRELEALERLDAFGRLGIGRAAVVQALDRLCIDLAEARGSDGQVGLSVPVLRAVLGEIGSPHLQRELLGLLLDLMHADGQLHPNESRLWRAALHHWGVPTAEVLMSVRLAPVAPAVPAAAVTAATPVAVPAPWAYVAPP